MGALGQGGCRRGTEVRGPTDGFPDDGRDGVANATGPGSLRVVAEQKIVALPPSRTSLPELPITPSLPSPS